MKMPNNTAGTVRYRNLAFRLIAAFMATHFIVAYGEPDSFFELIINPDYYLALLPSYGIALILVTVVHRITVRLDRSHDWLSHPLQRATLQLTLALLLPAILAFILAYLYFLVNGLNIFDTPYLRFDYPIIVLLLLLLNSYYVGYYLYWISKIQRQQQPDAQAHEITMPEQTGQTFMVSSGARTIPVPVSDICYFYREGDYNYVATFTGDRFIISQALDELQQKLNEQHFFRVNRQFLVQRKACTEVHTLNFGKLELKLSPATKTSVIVSQKRAKSFKQWFTGEA